MSLTTKCEHRFRESPKRKRSKVHDFAQSANTVRTPIPRAQSGMDGWGAGLSFQCERRNQEWSISRAARTFSRPRNNRSKARTELFIFEKIQDLRRPGRRRADFSFRKSFRPAAHGASRRGAPAGLQLFPKRKMPARGADRFLFHCVCRVPAEPALIHVQIVLVALRRCCKHTANILSAESVWVRG